MSLAASKELIAVVRLRYSETDREGKKVILDEVTKITGYHRKHAIRILTGQGQIITRERRLGQLSDGMDVFA